VLLLLSSAAFGQQLTGSLQGTVNDQTGAVIPDAKIELANDASGDVRRAATNGEGRFAITAVPPGTYTLTITAASFSTWQLKGIIINQGDERTIANIALTVGTVAEKVEITTSAGEVAQMDSGEVSTNLNQAFVDNIGLVGRDAGELLKIMPGMGINNGLTQGQAFSDKIVSSNTGPVGAFSANGTQPYGAMSYMLDGANLVDPGNVGTQIANVNSDMTAEVKVLMSSYGAEYAKGPVVFQAYGKSGGRDFHGEGYFYARNAIFDSLDSGSKAEGATRSNLPSEHYYYPGGNMGGPILLPFTHFNHNRNKLFWWFGYEYMNQVPVGSIENFIVPTSAMLGGNFSPSTLAPFAAQSSTGWSQALTTPCANAANGGCPVLNIVNGIVPPSDFDVNGLAELKLLPQPNMNPLTNNGFNYQYVDPGASGQFLVATNRWEQSEKVDYAISDNTKLTVSYTYQKENDLHPIATWWAPPQDAVPYPSAMPALTPSQVVMGNFTHVFSPSLVNETVVTYARYANFLSLANPSAANPTSVGMTTWKGLFGVDEKQIPNTLSWGGSLAEFMPQADFYGATADQNQFGALKSDPAVYDNLSKVWGTHTMKFGFYWDQNQNDQSNLLSNGGTQGILEYEQWGSKSTNNVIADELVGAVQSYTQSSSGGLNLVQYHQISGYAQDSWKIGKRLTVNYGIRFDHVGQYYTPGGPGYYVWDPATYVNTANAPANTGLVDHAENSSIPLSGNVSPWAYPLPRLGAAYDLFGNGKTVLRGGFAIFKYQSGVNAPSSTAGENTGQFAYTTGGFLGTTSLQTLTGLPTAAGSLNGGSVTAFLMGDNKVPSTADWNFTVSQQTPWRSVAEISYVGNHSYDGILLSSNGPGLYNANVVGLGTYFKPDPKTGAINCIQGVGCDSSFNANDYYPLINYQNINQQGNGSYANYNSLQASWMKNSGPAMVMVNYTFSKVLGVRDGYSGNGAGAGTMAYSLYPLDPNALRDNYGVLAYDHSDIFNFVGVFRMGQRIHGNPVLGGVVNGWVLQTNNNFQSGAPIQPNTGENLNVNFPSGSTTVVNGVSYSGINNQSYLGTNDVTLEPLVTCDPRKGLSSGQYFNPSCFTIPAPGTQGTIIWPYIKGPAFFNSDLSLYKDFKMGESRSLQFRIEAFNWLNHPNPQFGANGQSNDLKLNFAGANGVTSYTNTNNLTTGVPLYTVGQRLVELAVKFYF
jgi:hypothetical protein